MNRSLPGQLDKRKAMRGLVWLAVGNVVCAAMLIALGDLVRRYPLEGNGFLIHLFTHGVRVAPFAMTWSQALTWAIVFALILERRFVGLLCFTAFALVVGTIVWLGHVVRDPSSAIANPVWLLNDCLTLEVFAIAQGFRVLFGWRIALHEELPSPRRHQFAIADLIEWTVSIGVFFGLGQLCGWFQNPPLHGRFLAWQVLVSIPVGLAIVSRSRLAWLYFIIAVCLAIAATAVHELANAYLNSLPLRAWPGTRSILTLATCYIVVTVANFGLIRWLGFRWVSGGVEQRS